MLLLTNIFSFHKQGKAKGHDGGNKSYYFCLVIMVIFTGWL